MSKLLTITEVLAQAQKMRASDIHIISGIPITLRVDGHLDHLDENVMTPADCEAYARELSEHYDEISRIGEQDLAIGFPDGTRCRVNLFRQQGSVSAAIRILNNHIPTFDELGLPPQVQKLTDFSQGIVLVTGETGAGKSTTLACLLDSINHNQSKHIITLEDPIEYIYTPDKCIINQREIGNDTRSYQAGLNSILREDPDVILIGEMRNLSTIETALMAAETGHLVFATLHTNSAADTVDRIVDVFPAEQQAQIRTQLSMSLKAVVSLQLLPHLSGRGRVLATELMVTNHAIRNLIREGKSAQLANAITVSASEGNQLMDNSLITLFRQRKITSEVAIRAAHDKDFVRRSTLF